MTGFDWQGPSNYMQVNTVEKLVTECGFSTRAVERAVLLCSMFTTLATLIFFIFYFLLKCNNKRAQLRTLKCCYGGRHTTMGRGARSDS